MRSGLLGKRACASGGAHSYRMLLWLAATLEQMWWQIVLRSFAIC